MLSRLFLKPPTLSYPIPNYTTCSKPSNKPERKAANMNALFQTISGCLQHAAGTATLFDAWLKSVAVLTVAAGLCWLLPRAAAATRHRIWFLAVAQPALLAVARLPAALL